MRLELASLPCQPLTGPRSLHSSAAAGASEILAPDWQSQLRVIFLARPLGGDRGSSTTPTTPTTTKTVNTLCSSIRTVFSMTPICMGELVGWLVIEERGL